MSPSAAISVICVDDQDQEIGLCEKLKAHETGVLHRATSVFITTPPKLGGEPKVLLQQRSSSKYHSPGRWSNAACTHPLPNESIEDSARRSLWVELGLRPEVLVEGELHYKGYFTYKTQVHTHGEDLTEHELDHVFVAYLEESALIPFVPEEVAQVRWVLLSELKREMLEQRDSFTHWFPYLLAYLGDF